MEKRKIIGLGILVVGLIFLIGGIGYWGYSHWAFDLRIITVFIVISFGLILVLVGLIIMLLSKK
ncbi:MAG: hypothetical protein ACFFD5_16775 [Candidatus Thorarchaeota archaeon]